MKFEGTALIAAAFPGFGISWLVFEQDDSKIMDAINRCLLFIRIRLQVKSKQYLVVIKIFLIELFSENAGEYFIFGLKFKEK